MFGGPSQWDGPVVFNGTADNFDITGNNITNIIGDDVEDLVDATKVASVDVGTSGPGRREMAAGLQGRGTGAEYPDLLPESDHSDLLTLAS